MKKKPFSRLFPILFSFFILSTLLTNAQRPDESLGLKTKYSYEAKPSIFINLENLAKSVNPLEVTLHKSLSCSIQKPSLSQESNIAFAGPLMKGIKPFSINDNYATLRIDAQTSQIFFSQYNLESKGYPPKRSFVSTGNTIFSKTRNSEFLISSHKHHNQISIFTTKSEYIFFKFPPTGSISLLGTYAARKHQIIDFVSVQNKFLFAIESQELVVYNMEQLAEKKFEISTTHSSYSYKDKDSQNLGSLEALAVCDNIVFIAEGTSILVVDGTNSLDKLRVLNKKAIGAPILQIQVVGRSLIVLTTKEIVEYTFLKDCADLAANLSISSSFFGFGPSIAIEKTFVEIKGSSNGNYFAFANKLTNSIYIFQTGNQNSAHPVFHTYTVANKNLESIELFDYFTDYSENGLDLLVKQSGEQINIISFKKTPTGLDCSSFIPKTKSASVTISSRFCNNTMFNSTALANKRPYDPTSLCVHEFILEIHYKLTTKLVLCYIGAAFGCFTLVFFMVRVYQWKKSAGPKHIKFNNEKEPREHLDTSSNKLDISAISLPGSTSQREMRKPGAKTADGGPKKKTYSKKKNLQIRIPEIK